MKILGEKDRKYIVCDSNMDIQLSEFLITYKKNNYKLQIASKRLWFIFKDTGWEPVYDTEELEKQFTNIKG